MSLDVLDAVMQYLNLAFFKNDIPAKFLYLLHYALFELLVAFLILDN